ncbi:MAG TPA: mechanosensitive ion channel domain-containing protein, partial [Xanthomonadales bacterium]|nr:mechanosensitive ion channel domain-containing protein [Xanthomonadales bacterium]
MHPSALKSFFTRSMRFVVAGCLAASLLVLPGTQTTAWAQAIPGVTEPAAEAKPETPAEKIQADAADNPRDELIDARLTEIFANIPGLNNVSVNVKEGVIFLEGSVENADSLDQAQSLAERLSGVVTVINNIQRDRTLGTRLKAAVQSIESQFKDLIGNAPLLLLAIMIVVLSWLLARLVAKAQWLFRHMSANWFVQDMLRQALQLAIVIVGCIIALKLLDATALLGSLLGAVGIIGLAVSFATRDTVENYIASMLLSLRQPFEADDYVSIEGIEGKVLRLTPRATILMSMDGNHQRIPNAKVYKATIINYTRNPLRRFEFDVGVDTGIELSAPRMLAVETVSQLDG